MSGDTLMKKFDMLFRRRYQLLSLSSGIGPQLCSLSQCWNPVWPELVHVLCILRVSPSSYVKQSFCVPKTMFHWSHPSPLAFTIFLPPLPHRSLSLAKSLMKTFHLGLSVQSLSHSAHFIIAFFSCPLSFSLVLGPHDRGSTLS